jgi:hypothetical protein
MVEAPAVVVVRAYDDDDARDRAGVEEVERACEVGCMSGGGKMCLFTDLLGDPLCRIRHSPDSLMLVRIHVRAARSLSVCSVYAPTLWSCWCHCLAGGLRLSTVQ